MCATIVQGKRNKTKSGPFVPKKEREIQQVFPHHQIAMQNSLRDDSRKSDDDATPFAGKSPRSHCQGENVFVRA